MATPSNPMVDQLGRQIRDLRISVTDRCNFRCRYCMPREAFGRDHQFLDKHKLLTFEEITRVAAAFVALGTKKLRLTGGEPLLRRELETLVAQLRTLGCDLSLTTNGSLLAKQARALRDAGLERLTVSVDSLLPERFAKVTDGGVSLDSVLEGIAEAERVGFGSIKINTVVRRGENEDEIANIARHFLARGHIVRFIEFMDVGQTNQWQHADVVTAAEIERRLTESFHLVPLRPNYPGEVARRYRAGAGEVGIIASVSAPFCGGCTRARLSAEGAIYTCLFASTGTSLKELLRSGAKDEELAREIASVWAARVDRYSEQRSGLVRLRRRVEMSYIGG